MAERNAKRRNGNFLVADLFNRLSSIELVVVGPGRRNLCGGSCVRDHASGISHTDTDDTVGPQLDHTILVL